MPPLDRLTFDNSFARLPDYFFQRVRPTPLRGAHLASFNHAAADLIDLDHAHASSPEFLDVMNGRRQLPQMEPIASLYAGHQFGVYVPQLGDGRAILLGEVRTESGRWELQLKGAGATAFSRGGDGRAVLRSTIREYLCSEAMHGLGIPTTRALCLLGSDEPVYREEVESGASLLRMAPTHVRFGHFEVLFYRRELDHLKTLADYVIAGHFPHLTDVPNKYQRFLEEVIDRTARLMAQWMAVGFSHGVMNTDNMSILGLTIDYGPFGFLDDYEPGFICNHSDDRGRYAFDNQPSIGHWNLRCLAQALLPLTTKDEAVAALQKYERIYIDEYAKRMRAKVGLTTQEETDSELVKELLDLMEVSRTDYTSFFRALGTFSTADGATNDALRDHFLDRAAFDAWALKYRQRLLREGSHDAERRERMNQTNPKYVLRNALAQRAIARAEQRDYSEVDRLLKLLQRPFDEQPEFDRDAAPPPPDEKHVIVSCSS
jgi:uncharacterized protein YdiU (UPF0061 family)